MGKYQDALRLDIQESQKKQRDVTERALEEFERTGGFTRPPALRDLVPGIKENPTGFLPKGQRSNIGMMNYQGTPGQMYVNAPDHAPGTQWGTDLYPRPSVPPPAKETPPTDTGGGTVPTQPPDDVTGMGPDLDGLEMINASRIEQGLPPFESIEDFHDFVSDQYEGGPDSWLPPLVANEGGLASLPVYMAQGGEGFANLGAHIASSMPAFSSARQLGLQMQGKMKGDLGQMDTAGGPGYNTVGTEEYESRQRPVKAWRKRNKERRASRKEGRQQRKAERIAAQNDPGGYEQVVSKFAPKKGRSRSAFWGPQQMVKDRIGNPKLQELANAAAWAGNPGLQLAGRGMKHYAIPWLRSLFRRGPQGRNEGGIVSLPGFSNGDLAQIPNSAEGMRDSIGSRLAGAMGGGSGLEGLSREELIKIIESMGGGNSQGNMGSQLGSDLATIGQGIGKLFGGMGGGGGGASVAAAADGGLMYLSHGDMVEDFPRMNGPISGPGTETSDDIPAMLSDGEFVVNAKAVRGVGKLNGANESKSDQRREGARMMYALQNAGEQAIRRA